jgi:hypothetical protein
MSAGYDAFYRGRRVMITGDEKRPLSKDDSWQTIEADNVITTDGLGLLDEGLGAIDPGPGDPGVGTAFQGGGDGAVEGPGFGR